MNKKNIFRIHLLSLFLLASCVTPTTTPPVESSSPLPTMSPSANPSVTPDASQSPSVQPSSSVNPSSSISPTPSTTASAGTSVNTSTTLSIPSDFLKLSYNDYYSAELKWQQITGAKSYRIYQDGKLIADNLTGSMYNVTSLTPNTNYTFDIVAVNETGQSNKSTVNVRTFIPSTSTNNNSNYTPEPINPRNVSLENVIFVDQSSTYGANNGTTWNNAYTNLQDALARTDLSGKQIWIAKGTYYPTTSFMITAPVGPRGISFVIPAGVKVYGGFFGTELSIDSRTSGNTVTLSGDLNKNDSTNNYSDNSYRVVRMSNNLTNPSTIDTLTITAGNASDGGFQTGAGLYVDNSSPIINNVIFSKNQSATTGGALYATGTTNITITGSTFNNNTAKSGGAIFSDINNLNISSSSFTSNIATETVLTGGGGAIFSNSPNMNIKSSRFQNNIAVVGGAIYNTNIATASIIENSTFSLNQATLANNGGGGAIANLGTLTFNGSNSISNNSSAYSAGGIANVGIMTINGNTSITGNTAVNNGGGISNAGTLNLNDNTIVTNNSATVNGGGIENYAIINPAIININNFAKVTNNSATVNGGGIYNSNSNATTNLNNSANINNNTSVSGGGIYNNAGIINLNDTVSINRNNATTGNNNTDFNNKGGGVYNYVGTVNLNDSSSITNNNATNDATPANSGAGGGIFNHSVTTTYAIGSPSYNSATSPGASVGTNVKDNTIGQIDNYTQTIYINNSGN